jgi:MFS family permease
VPRQKFVRFVAASGLTNLADGVSAVAWAWVASLLTRDPLLVALVPLALRLPWFLCAVPAGMVADRMDRRVLILRMDVLRALAYAAAALALWLALPLAEAPARGLGEPALFAALLLSAATVGVAEVFRDNAAQTMLPALVANERLERANGQLWSVEMIGNAMVGPALGAMLLAVALPLPFLLNAAALAGAVWLVLGLKGGYRPATPSLGNWRAEIAEGVRFLRETPFLLVLACITGGWNLFASMVTIALVLHVQENLGLGPTAFGLVLAGGAAGGILGGLTGEHVVRRLGQGRTAQWMLTASVPSFLAIAFAPGPVTLFLALAFFEYTGLVWNVVSVTFRQRRIPDRLLGRVNSLYRLMAWGMIPLGLVLSGLVVRAGEAALPRGRSRRALIGWKATPTCASQ